MDDASSHADSADAAIGAVDGARDAADALDAFDASAALDASTTLDVVNDAAAPDAAAPDATDASLGADATDAFPGADASSVPLLRFAIFGDVRPPDFNDTAGYPTAIINSVMDGIVSQDVQFAVGTGDYLFAYNTSATVANAQLDLLLAAEARFGRPVYHALGNHECTTSSTSNCPLENESALIQAYRTRLVPDWTATYHDWTVATPFGDAHFIATAPNAWSDTQAAWLDAALAQPAQYTFVIAHEPPTSFSVPPGTMPIETAIAARATPVTMRLYGHVHYYRRPALNTVVVGNAGAPLSGSTGYYGFMTVVQRGDGQLAATAFEIGDPPMVRDTFVLRPDGTAGM